LFWVILSIMKLESILGSAYLEKILKYLNPNICTRQRHPMRSMAKKQSFMRVSFLLYAHLPHLQQESVTCPTHTSGSTIWWAVYLGFRYFCLLEISSVK